ncbi:CIC11C00000002430 [Sungouiella intermedia]|uniref:CIC11C00000002430 n=1 Tax=Sungouiella intermedia TaxID=45354 RepID=A0A1L0D2X3_9ASCO|nr:CIC11C00000002430 [[Candida] intermedia]SGZ51692.1 CIC11C00000004192 [[Candida] intermedia]
MENSNQFLETVAEYDQDSLRFQKIEFANKLILNVLTNDIMDTTLDIPLSTQATINDGLSDEDSLGVEPVVLVGNPHNLKIQVVAGQIGKVVRQLKNPRNVILSLGSRWFGSGDSTEDGDFEKLMFVLGNIKKLLE